MYKNVLRKMQQCVQRRHYETRTHADLELDKDDLSPADMRRAILTGRLIERQWDYEYGEYNYLVQARNVVDEEIVVVAKVEATN